MARPVQPTRLHRSSCRTSSLSTIVRIHTDRQVLEWDRSGPRAAPWCSSAGRSRNPSSPGVRPCTERHHRSAVGIPAMTEALVHLEAQLMLRRVDERVTLFDGCPEVRIRIAVGELRIGVRVGKPEIQATVERHAGVQLEPAAARFTRRTGEEAGSNWAGGRSSFTRMLLWSTWNRAKVSRPDTPSAKSCARPA